MANPQKPGFAQRSLTGLRELTQREMELSLKGKTGCRSSTGVLICGLVGEFVGVQTLLTGLLGSDDDQFRV
jgi:hypothetical protein